MSLPVKSEEEANSSPTGSHSGVIRFEVDNVSNLCESGDASPTIEVGGVKWRAVVNKETSLSDSWQEEEQQYLSVWLSDAIGQRSPWSVDIAAEYTLVNEDNERNGEFKESMTYRHDDFCPGGYRLEWRLLMDEKNGFIKDDKITVEVRFTISNMRGFKTLPQFDFTDANDPRHDVALVIEGEKVYASKQYLALHSPVFNAMFYGNFEEKDKKEIELNEIDREEFIELLNVIYPSCKSITAYSVDFLLKLGDRFQIECVMNRVESYFEGVDWFPVVRIASHLRLADQYNLFRVQEHCLAMLKTTAHFQDIKKTFVYSQLSDAMKVAIFERMLKTAK